MHDFHLANEIVKIVQSYAEKNNLKNIKKISLELGNIVEHGDNIKPENLKYNINLLLPCEVKIKKTKSNFWKLINIEGE